MFDPVSTNRRLAWHAIVWQILLTIAVAVIWWLFSPDLRNAYAVLAGGASITVSSAIALVIALGGGVISAHYAYLRLFAGYVMKWCLVVLLLVIFMVVIKLPIFPIVGGVITAVIATVIAHSVPFPNLGNVK